MDFAPDGRLFVLEQGGNVKLVRGDGSTWTALHLNVDSQGERGLLGIAFDPNFAFNHFAYLYYTNPNAGGSATGVHNQLSRFTVDDTDPLRPVFTSEAPILDWNNLSSATNHNGGAIHFGIDGMLYADAGDNVQTFTLGGNTYRVSQTLNDLLGKQLRIDVANFNNGTATRDDPTVGHLIPADNPFVGVAPGINQLIYALGLRNPFTFAVQPGTGVIFINDVGETTWEEIDQSLPGGNYGWSGGNTDGFGQSPPGPGIYHDPLLAYNHTGGPAGGGIAIVGGTFYDPATDQFPAAYVGKYFYADLGGGWIRVFDPAHPGNAFNPDTSVPFASDTPGSLRDLKVDAAGNLYYLAGNGGVIGKISFHGPQPGLPGPSPFPSGLPGLPPSQGGGGTPFVSTAFGPFGEVLEVVGSDGTLTQLDAFGAHNLTQLFGLGPVQSASLAFGPFGPVLEVVDAAGTLTQYDAFGAQDLTQLLGLTAVRSASLAFGPLGPVLELVSPGGTLIQLDAFGAHDLTQFLGLGSAQSANITFGPLGAVLEVVTPDGTLTQYDAFGAHPLLDGVAAADLDVGPFGVVLDVISQAGTLLQLDAAGAHPLGTF
jgi:glucose/arabinose dehydrogenase